MFNNITLSTDEKIDGHKPLSTGSKLGIDFVRSQESELTILLSDDEKDSLTIKQFSEDEEEGISTVVWDCALLLVDYLTKINPTFLSSLCTTKGFSRHFVDLGCGTGIIGMVLTRLLEDILQPGIEHGKVTCIDIPVVEKYYTENVTLNFAEKRQNVRKQVVLSMRSEKGDISEKEEKSAVSLNSTFYGETDLNKILIHMKPSLSASHYKFYNIAPKSGIESQEDLFSFMKSAPNALADAKVILRMQFWETEGLTILIDVTEVDTLLKVCYEHHWKLQQVPSDYRCITIQVHSSLDSVGLTAKMSKELAAANISCNVVAGFFHDHLFVPDEDAEDAVHVLNRISDEAYYDNYMAVGFYGAYLKDKIDDIEPTSLHVNKVKEQVKRRLKEVTEHPLIDNKFLAWDWKGQECPNELYIDPVAINTIFASDILYDDTCLEKLSQIFKYIHCAHIVFAYKKRNSAAEKLFMENLTDGELGFEFEILWPLDEECEKKKKDKKKDVNTKDYYRNLKGKAIEEVGKTLFIVQATHKTNCLEVGRAVVDKTINGLESMMSGVVEKFANEETDEWTKDEMEQFIDNFMENTGSNESEIADNIVKVKERALDEILIDIALEDRIFE